MIGITRASWLLPPSHLRLGYTWIPFLLARHTAQNTSPCFATHSVTPSSTSLSPTMASPTAPPSGLAGTAIFQRDEEGKERIRVKPSVRVGNGREANTKSVDLVVVQRAWTINRGAEETMRERNKRTK